MDLKSTYNKIAEDWFKDHDSDTWWQPGTDKFLSFVPKNGSILDVGCGGGQKTRYMHSKGFNVSGVDLSEKMIEIAKREAPEINFEMADVYEIDKYPKKIDAIFAQAVLLHVPKSKITEVLAKLKSRLNEKGILYVAVKAREENGAEEEIVTEDDDGCEYSRFFSFFNMDELKKYFKEVGLDLIWNETTRSGSTDWLQIIGRKN